MAQNVAVREEALFDYRFADFDGFDEDAGLAFKPYTIKEVGGAKMAVIGQAFPYTPIANPQRFIPDWTFGIQDERMQEMVDKVRDEEAGRRGGHLPQRHGRGPQDGLPGDAASTSSSAAIPTTACPRPPWSRTRAARPWSPTPAPTASSSASWTWTSRTARCGTSATACCRSSPTCSSRTPRWPSTSTRCALPHKDKLEEQLAAREEALYRRGNFNGTFDQVICDALRKVNDAQVSLSPGFRWGTSVLPGQAITMDNVMDQTCITYPETYRREMKGRRSRPSWRTSATTSSTPIPMSSRAGTWCAWAVWTMSATPSRRIGKRITDMTLDDGTKIEADKSYVVAGWATVGSQAPGEPIWETVAKYLRDVKTVRIEKLNTPVLKNVAGNPGIADYPKMG